MALDHLKDFLIDCEMDTKVAKVARLVSILGEAAFEDKIISTRLMNEFYEHYFQNFGYAGRPIAANRIYEDINKDKWDHDRLQETFETAAYIFMKYEKEIVKAENTKKVVDFMWKWKTIFRFLVGALITGGSVFLLIVHENDPLVTAGEHLYYLFLMFSFLAGIMIMLCCNAHNW